nr:Cys-tRNA(Pro) deacylase [Corynebacterium sp. c6VSa_13]
MGAVAKKKQKKGATPATLALERAGVAFSVIEFAHDPAVSSFGQEAAEALDRDPASICKTLLVDTDRGVGVAVVPVTGSLNLKAVAAALGAKKAAMCDPHAAERMTGYVVGGISPIGQKKALPTVLDSSIAQLDRVLVSGGKRGFDVELAPQDLAQVTGAVFAPIARD